MEQVGVRMLMAGRARLLCPMLVLVEDRVDMRKVAG